MSPGNPCKVARLKFFVMGFRGDWKAFRQVFNLTRHYGTDEACSFNDDMHVQTETIHQEKHIHAYKYYGCYVHENPIQPFHLDSLQICWLCKASKGASDVTMAFTDVSDQAPWRSTFLTVPPWDTVPQYIHLFGFSLKMVVADLLHCWNLGVSRDVVGCVLKLVLQSQTVFQGTTISERFEQATIALKTFARNHGHVLRLKRLTQKKITWATKKYPEFKGSGSDTHVVAVWLEDLLIPRFSDQYPDLCTLLWTSNRAMRLLYSAGWFLTDDEIETVKGLGRMFTQTFLQLASQAVQSHTFMWRVRPKLHQMTHLLDCYRACNPIHYATWMDEDWLKKIAKVMNLTSVHTAQCRVLQRWLLSFKGNLGKMSK